jgi:radical SAM enzyme (TIGR01210 family)
VYTYLCAPHGYVNLDYTLGVYFNGFGCRFAQKGECTMCNYRFDASVGKAATHNVEHQLLEVFSEYKTQRRLKFEIYTGGSFFDDNEVPEETRELILLTVSQWPFVKTIWCESRPEFITPLKVERLARICNKRRKHFVVSLGLETASETIRRLCINKSSSMKDYESASRSILAHADLCVTCLFKPIFLLEVEAINDMLNTIDYCKKQGCREFQINCSNIHPNTIMELLWRNGHYRLPWLWSIVQVIENTRSTEEFKISVTGLPMAGAQVRLYQNSGKFSTNCHSCTPRIYEALDLQKKTRDSSELIAIRCPCRGEWKELLRRERDQTGTFQERVSTGVSRVLELMMSRSREDQFTDSRPTSCREWGPH